MKLELTPDQWRGLLEDDESGDCPWMPSCCGNIGSAREALRAAYENGGVFTDKDLNVFLSGAITHDVINEAWLGHPNPNPYCDWVHREGSPWPTIFQTLREYMHWQSTRA